MLVIDDDRDVADALVELLSWAGYQTTVAHSGAMALRLADEARPDVVLLDLGLPDVDGLDLCTRLRSDARWNVVTIIGLNLLIGFIASPLLTLWLNWRRKEVVHTG